MVIQIGNDLVNVIFQRKKIKKTYLRITNKRELLITSPLKLSDNDIHQLINENLEWLKSKIAKVNVIIINNNEFMLFGKIYKVELNNQKGILIKEDIIYTDRISRIEDYAIKEINKHFINIVNCIKFPFIPILNFRRMKTRWGVCHFKVQKVILNRVLIHLPWDLIDYVIFHELTHFKVPNHSKTFYQELSVLCHNHKSLKSQLIEYSSLL